MRSSTPTRGKSRSGAQRRADQAARVNRAQVRAMEARSAIAPPGEAPQPRDSGRPAMVASGGTAALSPRRPLARPRMLTRAEEYAYIKADMRRLIITAGALFVIMIVLLLVIG